MDARQKINEALRQLDQEGFDAEEEVGFGRVTNLRWEELAVKDPAWVYGMLKSGWLLNSNPCAYAFLLREHDRLQEVIKEDDDDLGDIIDNRYS